MTIKSIGIASLVAVTLSGIVGYVVTQRQASARNLGATEDARTSDTKTFRFRSGGSPVGTGCEWHRSSGIRADCPEGKYLVSGGFWSSNDDNTGSFAFSTVFGSLDDVATKTSNTAGWYAAHAAGTVALCCSGT